MPLQFYSNLAPMSSFSKATNLAYYQRLPQDWLVIIADVEGSTKAIEAGRYRDVNLIGAACVAAVQNAIGTRNFPFCFGGDGASLLIPLEFKDAVSKALVQLQYHSQTNFGLHLRVGIIPAKDLYSRDSQILVAKYALSPGNFHALIQGGGLELAEKLIKDPKSAAAYLLPGNSDNQYPNLDSLSCRWSPIQNRNGQIVSLIVMARSHDQAPRIFDQILTEIHPLFEAEHNRPPHLGGMLLKPFWSSFLHEVRLRSDLGIKGVLSQILIPLIWTRIAFKWPLNSSMQNFANSYPTDTMLNSDYKKIDDVLRMVLDCSNEQLAKLEKVLKQHFDKAEIFFGLHLSDKALMTCIVEGLNQDSHIHFIDGDKGGYSMAAKQLKIQKVESLAANPVNTLNAE